MTQEIRVGVISALIIGIGLAMCGWFVGTGFRESRTRPRTVSVKGLAEREVRADLALWPLRFVASGDDLAAVQQQVLADGERVRAFLQEHGFAAGEYAVQNLQVVDRQAAQYDPGTGRGGRYIVAQLIMVRSGDVDKIAEATRAAAELLGAGVTLAAEYGPIKPVYLFNGLNDLKVDMLAEATARARESAEQFAVDSQSRLGGIHTANQGVIQILPRDQIPGGMEEDQIEKVVRVVTTVQYLLAD